MILLESEIPSNKYSRLKREIDTYRNCKISLEYKNFLISYCFDLKKWTRVVHFEPWMDNFSEWLHWNVYSNMTCSCPFNLYVGLLHHFRHSEWFRIKDEQRLELTLSLSGQIQLTFKQYDDNFFEQTQMILNEKWHWKVFWISFTAKSFNLLVE